MTQPHRKVLLIEDDRFLRKVYGNKLRQEGFETIDAINGEEGLHKMLKERPDFVILDLILPRKNGFDVLADMKADDKIKNIPVLILTNLGQKSDVARGLAMGAVDYLIKTELSLSEIVQKVKENITIAKREQKKKS